MDEEFPEEDPLSRLKTQHRIRDTLLISNMDNENIGQIEYEITWIYNKKGFLTDLLDSMKKEKDDLIDEIKQ